jgi:hypothetical protein
MPILIKPMYNNGTEKDNEIVGCEVTETSHAKIEYTKEQ